VYVIKSTKYTEEELLLDMALMTYSANALALSGPSTLELEVLPLASGAVFDTTMGKATLPLASLP